MKKMWLTVPLTVIIVFFTLLLLNSCEKDPISPEPVGQPVIFSDYVINNGIVTLNWVSEFATSVTCNGKSVSLSGSINFPIIDSLLVFVAKNEKFEAKKQVQVEKSAEPIMTIDTVPTELPYKHCGYDKVKFIMHFTNAYKFEVDGIGYELFGSKDYTIILDPNKFTDTATYIVKTIGNGGEVSQTIKIALGKPTAIQLLEKAVSNGRCVWHPCYAESDLSGVRKADIPVSTIDRQFLLVPYTRQLIYAYDGGYLGGVTNDITWVLNADSTYSVGSNTEQYKIESVNPTELIIRTKIIHNGQTHYLWDYYHPQ